MRKQIIKLKSTWCVALLGGCFLISLSYGLKIVRVEMNKIRSLEANRQELKKLARQNRHQVSALAASVQGNAVEPETLFDQDFQNGLINWESRETLDLPEGFRHHKVTMVVKEIQPEALKPVFNRLENTQPAWRITHIQLSTQAGSISGSLQLEALDKTPLEL